MFAPNLAGVAAAREEINQRALVAEPVLITQKQATALGMVGLNPSDLNKFENCGKGNDSRDSKQMVVLIQELSQTGIYDRDLPD